MQHPAGCCLAVGELWPLSLPPYLCGVFAVGPPPPPSPSLSPPPPHGHAGLAATHPGRLHAMPLLLLLAVLCWKEQNNILWRQAAVGGPEVRNCVG